MRTHSEKLRLVARALGAVAIGSLWLAPPAGAQFVSGSTGADGALVFTCDPAGETIEWDPVGLDPEGDSVFELSTISVPAECTVLLTVGMLGHQSIRWLATGAVTIDGTLVLDGGVGHNTQLGSTRMYSVPAPGGFPGGLGLVNGLGTRTSGFGPGASAGRNNPAGAGHAAAGLFGSSAGNRGQPYGNEFLLPLLGGSGGAGDDGGGGAGGGAILIASSVSIALGGEISARGGSGGSTSAAGGSGGAIRLVAPLISGDGALRTNGGAGPGGGGAGSSGRIRLEATEYQWSGAITGGSRLVGLALNTVLIAEEPIPLLRLVSIAGESVPALPQGLFNPTDIVMNEAGMVTIEVAAENVPVGTVVDVEIHNESLGSQTVQTTPLAGADDSATTATANAFFEAGFSSVAIRADFTP